MSKIMIIIGLILTGLVTLPVLALCLLLFVTSVYRDYRERPDAPPPSKDEWRLM